MNQNELERLMGEWLRAKEGQKLPAGQADDWLCPFTVGLIEALARVDPALDQAIQEAQKHLSSRD